jgi:uncharacterized repeat protein (TIGR04138 family)
MEDIDLAAELERITQADPRYKLEAYLFVMNALEYTLAKLGRRGHVGGRELLEGVKDLARERFGPTARMVFEHWGVAKTDDVGEIVFNLVEAKVLGKTEQDSREDFRDVYDFAEVFERGFDWKVRRPK